jgi:exosortase
MIRLFVAFYVPLMIAYGDTMVWLWDRWWLGEYYSHGPLLPLVAGYVIFRGRDSWQRIEIIPDIRGWWLLGFGLLLRFCGAAQMVDSLSAVSLLFTLPGIVLLTVGMARLRRFLPVILLILFATPMPMGLTASIAFELKEVAITGAIGLGNAFGLEATRHGASIMIPGQTAALPVADACGGLRSLLALTALGYCLAFFIGSADVTRRVTLLLVTVPAAVLVNMLRITGLCFVAKVAGVHYAGGVGHTIMNVVAVLANIAILLALDAWLEKRAKRMRRSVVVGGDQS